MADDLSDFCLEQFFDETIRLEPDQILENLSSLKSSLQELLESVPCMVVYVIKCLHKVFVGSTKKMKIKVADFVADSGLVKYINDFFGVIGKQSDDSIISNLDTFVEQVIILCSYFVKHTMSTIYNDEFVSMIENIQTAMSEMNACFNVDLPNTLISDYVDLKQSVIDHHGPKQSNHSQLTCKNQPPPDDFRKLVVYPTVKELNEKKLNYLRENIVKGPYANIDDYLDVHFRLLREDFVERFRHGLRLYREAKAAAKSTDTLPDRYEQLRIYFKTKFERYRFKESKSLMYTLNFDVDNKMNKSTSSINSNMFIYGSILLLTRDDFRTFFYAIVSHNSLERLSAGRVSVTLQDNVEINDEFFDHYYVMAESDDYFGPYQLVLEVLQKMTEKTFPMVKHIVDVNTKIASPSYLKKFRVWNLFGHDVDPLDVSSWPSNVEIGLDQHQYRGLVHGLTRSLSIIQGPPGTGKTYLGLKIMEVLLSNMEAYEFYIRAPILVICFTNHALDQFLEGALNFTKNIIRVGGQSQSEALEKFNLNEARAGRAKFEDKQSDSIRRQLNAMYSMKIDILQRMDNLNAELELLNNPVGIFSYRTLVNVMRDTEKDKVIGDCDLLLWLFAADKPDDISDEKLSMDDERGQKKAGPRDFQYRMRFFLMNNLKNNIDLAAEEDIDLLTYCLTLEDWRSICTRLSEELANAQFRLGDSDVDESKRELFSQLEQINEHIMPYETLKKFFETKTWKSDVFDKPCKDLRQLRITERWALYAYWIGALKKQRYNKLKRLKLDYRICEANNQKLQRRDEANILKNATVVGMTTSGAARRRETLELLKSSVVIVEEAAEVLEAHIIASMAKETEHLIMIGDHQQLRPRTLSHHLRYKYQLDVSLFERLIKNDFECPILQTQHRMRPEICALITPNIYKNLENDLSVYEYESIEGVTKNLFFLNHNQPERSVNDSISIENQHEAEFICRFCVYLLLQGYSPSKITILVMYNGQLAYLLERRKQIQDMREIRITTVDDYQGEENDIVLLSLVRSNSFGRIGFLNIENRICVSLSRAKKGFYIVGNMDILAAKCSLWRKIETTLKAQNAIGNVLTLRCKRHGTENEVKEAKDFDKVVNGGCSKICDYEFECGHRCTFPCHHTDQNHVMKYTCREMCARLLSCGHKELVPCSQKLSDVYCTINIEYESAICGHIRKRMCFQKEEATPCDEICGASLKCGHFCSMTCHQDYDNEHEEFKCQEPCKRIFVNCGHQCSKRCFEKCGNCVTKEMVDLKCGHKLMLECSNNDIFPKCTERCLKTCLLCTQRCSKNCWENCHPCPNEVVKTIEKCGHTVTVACSVTPSPAMCPIDGAKQLNHAFARKFNEFQNRRETNYDTDEAPNDTQKLSNGSIQKENVFRNDDEACKEVMECGDPCSGTFGRCLQGRLHKGCRKYCSEILICGHKCRNPCRDVCQPCEKPSKFICKHLKSSENLGKCGTPFSCEKKCDWKCDHKSCTKRCEEKCDRSACYKRCCKKLMCQHDCIGFCGEPCPYLCAVCDSNIIAHEVYGYWTHCRCVFLLDCFHTIESNTMEEYIVSIQPGLPNCPRCKTPIMSSLRFMNDVKRSYDNSLASINAIYRTDSRTANIIDEIMCEIQEYNFNTFGLEDITKIKHFLLQTVRDGAKTIPKCFISPIYFVTKLLTDLGRRLSNLNLDIFELNAYQRGLDLFIFILRNIKKKSLLSNVQLIDDFRNEILRFHKVLNYCSLIGKVQDMNVKKTPEMKELCVDLERCLYTEQKYSLETDNQFDETFYSLLHITINQSSSIIDEDIIRFAQMDGLAAKLRHATLL